MSDWINRGQSNGVETWYNLKTRKTKYKARFRLPNGKYFKSELSKKYGVQNISEAKATVKLLKEEQEDALQLGILPTKESLDTCVLNYLSAKGDVKKLGTSPYSQYSIYKSNVAHLIGKKQIQRINLTDLELVRTTAIAKGLAHGTIRDIRFLLTKVLDKHREKHPLQRITSWKGSTYQPPEDIVDILYRHDKTALEVAQSLYKSIKNIKGSVNSSKGTMGTKESYQLVMYIALMCGRRISEVSNVTLKMVDLRQKRITVPKTITKTKIAETYAIPDEVVKLIESLNIKPTDTLATFKTNQPYSKLFKRFLLEAIGASEEELNRKSTHHTRHLMATSLGNLAIDKHTIDSLLSHSKGNREVAERYNQANHRVFEDKQKALQVYWSALRK